MGQKTKSNSKQDTNLMSDTPRIDKQEQSNWNEKQTKNNRIPTLPSNPEPIIIQEQKMNLENL